MHHLNLRKNRLHRKAMHGTEIDKENYRQYRREFKSKIENKIQSNLDINTNKGDISKKFWAHVKATAKSTRIPETVNYKNTYSSKSKNKADLFNSFFYDQFSSLSKYSININFNSTREPHINMSTEMVYNILKNINSNKAPGPDGIDGNVLKNCARNLSVPLSLIFNLSFNTGSLPTDWKMAHIVPVYKKIVKQM